MKSDILPGARDYHSMDLQADVENHGGYHVEGGEVHAQTPGQVEEDEQCARESLAECVVGAPGRNPAGQTRPPDQTVSPPSVCCSLPYSAQNRVPLPGSADPLTR